MPYFFIIPVYLILLLGLFTVAVVLRSNEKSKRASRYVFAGALGTLPGIILTNIIVTVAGLLPLWISKLMAPPQWLGQLLGLLAALCLLLGPFVASAVGVVFGFLTGCGLAWCRRR